MGGHVPDGSQPGASCGEGQKPDANNHIADGTQKEAPLGVH